MNLQKFTLFLVVAVFLSFPIDIEAKKSSWGSSSKKSYSSSYKKSSSKSYKSIFGSTKKKSSGSSSYYGSSTKKPTTTSNSYGSSSKKGSYSSTKTTPIASSSFDKARIKKVKKEQSKKAYKEYKETKNKFKETPKVEQTTLTPTKKSGEIKVQKIRKKSFDLDFDDFYSRKHSYYDNYRGRNYIYNHRSSFGIWDAVFLWALLDNPLSGATHIYNHYNDSGVQQWLNVAKEEAKTDEELKQKLSQLENEVAKMKATNLEKDESYLPNNIEPDLAFSDNFVKNNKDVFYDSNKPKEESSESSWTSVIISIAMLFVLGYWLIFVRKS